MRSISLWAKHHRQHARIIIIICRFLLICLACFLGTQLSQSAVMPSPLWTFFFMVVFFITGAHYPSERSAKNYRKRKLYDLIIASCGFLMAVCVTSELNKPFIGYQSVEATAAAVPSLYKFPEAEKLLKQFEKGEKIKFSARKKRIIKKEFNYQLLKYAKAKFTGNKSTADQTLLIILACIAAVGLLYLVAGLACTLSCNGSDAAAIIVAILGTAGVIWGLVAIIRSIKRKRSKAK